MTVRFPSQKSENWRDRIFFAERLRFLRQNGRNCSTKNEDDKYQKHSKTTNSIIYRLKTSKSGTIFYQATQSCMPSQWKSFFLTRGKDLCHLSIFSYETKRGRIIQVSVPAILLRFGRIWTWHAHLFIFFPCRSLEVSSSFCYFWQSHTCPNSWNPLIRLDSLLDESNEKGSQWHLDSSSWLFPWKSLKWVSKWDAEKRVPNARNTSLRTPTLLSCEFNYSHQRSQLRKSMKIIHILQQDQDIQRPFTFKRSIFNLQNPMEILSIPRGARPGWSKVPYIVWVLINKCRVDSLFPNIPKQNFYKAKLWKIWVQILSSSSLAIGEDSHLGQTNATLIEAAEHFPYWEQGPSKPRKNMQKP